MTYKKVSEGVFSLFLFWKTFYANMKVGVCALICCHSHSIQEWSENRSRRSNTNRFIWHDEGMSWLCPLVDHTNTHTHTHMLPSVACNVSFPFFSLFYWFLLLKSYKTALDIKEMKRFFSKFHFTLRWFNLWCVVTWLCWMFNVLKHIGGKRLSDFHRFI